MSNSFSSGQQDAVSFKLACRYCLLLPCLALSPLSSAQNVTGEALNGTVTLSGSFLPDPHAIEIRPGGDTEVEDLGASCTGYIFAEQPDLKLVLDSASSSLGIFVSADIDTTLVINDPQCSWHCNDDAAFLSNANPGILFDDPAEGTYDIWVGTYSEIGTSATGKLVITQWATSDWAGLDLNTDGNSSVAQANIDGIDFGDDLSTWANDGECDDPRFTGAGYQLWQRRDRACRPALKRF